MNWCNGESNPKILKHSAAFFQRFDHGVALKVERNMSHLNIAFDRYASIGTVMHYILVISVPFWIIHTLVYLFILLMSYLLTKLGRA